MSVSESASSAARMHSAPSFLGFLHAVCQERKVRKAAHTLMPSQLYALFVLCTFDAVLPSRGPV